MNVEDAEETTVPAALLASGVLAALFLFMGAIVVAHRTPGATNTDGSIYMHRIEMSFTVRRLLAIDVVRLLCSPECVTGLAIIPLIRAIKMPHLRPFANVQCAISCCLLALMMAANTFFYHYEPNESNGLYPDVWVTTALAYYGFVGVASLQSNPRPWYAGYAIALALAAITAATAVHAYYGAASLIDFAGATCAGGALLLSGAWFYERYR